VPMDYRLSRERRAAIAVPGGVQVGFRGHHLERRDRPCRSGKSEEWVKTKCAPAMVFASVPVSDFLVTPGAPRRRRSSSSAERSLCSDCGSPLAMRLDHQPDTIDLAVVSLDDPSTTALTFHIWNSTRIGWFDVRDDWPGAAASTLHPHNDRHCPGNRGSSCSLHETRRNDDVQ
jgi:hypothetical protein